MHTIKLLVFFLLGLTQQLFADPPTDDDFYKIFLEFEAAQVDPDSNLAKEINEIYLKVWTAALDEAQKNPGNSKLKTFDFVGRRLAPPRLVLFDTAHKLAFYSPQLNESKKEIVIGEGFVGLSLAFINELKFQKDIVAVVLAHELVHSLQDESQLMNLMLAEQQADRDSVKIVARAGYNPNGAVELAKILEILNPIRVNVEQQNQLDLGDLMKALDSHKLPHVRRDHAETAVNDLGLTVRPINFKSLLSDYELTAKFKMSDAINNNWTKVQELVKKLGASNIIQDESLAKKLTVAILDVVAETHFENERAFLAHGYFEPMFDILVSIGKSSVKDLKTVKQYENFLVDLFSSLDADLSYQIASKSKKVKHGFFEKLFKSLKSDSELGSGEKANFYAEQKFKGIFPDSKAPAHQFVKLIDGLHTSLINNAYNRHIKPKMGMKFSPQIMLKAYLDAFITIEHSTGSDMSDASQFYIAEFGPESNLQVVYSLILSHLEDTLQIEDPAHFSNELHKISFIKLYFNIIIGSEIGLKEDNSYSYELAQKFEEKITSGTTSLFEKIKNKINTNYFNQAEKKLLNFHYLDTLLWSSRRNLNYIRLCTALNTNAALIVPNLHSVIHGSGNLNLNEKDVKTFENYTSNHPHILSDKSTFLKYLDAFEESNPRLSVIFDQFHTKERIVVHSEVSILTEELTRLNPTLTRKALPWIFQFYVQPDIDSFAVNEKITSQNVFLSHSALEHKGDKFDQKGVISSFTRERNLKSAQEQLRILKEFIEAGTFSASSDFTFDAFRSINSDFGVHVPFRRLKLTTKGFGGIELVAPRKNYQYKPSERRALIDAMVFSCLDYYGDVLFDVRSRFVNKIGVEEAHNASTHISQVFLMPEFIAKIDSVESPEQLVKLFALNLVDWRALEQSKESDALKAMILDNPDLTQNVFFRKTVEEAQRKAIKILTEKFGFEEMSEIQKFNILRKLSAKSNGTGYLDKVYVSLLSKASDQTLSKIYASKNVKNFLTNDFFHPSQRIIAAAHVARGGTNFSGVARLVSEVMRNKDAYTEVWNYYFGDRDAAGFSKRPITRENYLLIQKHDPSKIIKTDEDTDSKIQKSSAAEFYERLLHGMDVLLTRLQEKTAFELVKYLTSHGKVVLSPESVVDFRKITAPLLGRKTINYALESELLNLYLNMEALQQRALVHTLLLRHPTLLKSEFFRESLSESPLFSEETYKPLTDLKKNVWMQMSSVEKAGLTAVIFERGYFKGTLGDNDELILEVLEVLGTVGRKGAQLLKVHGHFLRPSLRLKLSKFRDDNHHSTRIEMIPEFERFFADDMGKQFWVEVDAVLDDLGAGSLKTPVKLKLVDGTEVVTKIIDPIVAKSSRRKLALIKESIETWTVAPTDGATKGIALYLIGRLITMVETELDLGRENTNTNIHKANMEARGDKGVPRHTTAVECVGALCSPNVNTVKYLAHRGNANQVPATPHEREAIVSEILAQVLRDNFVHGDLQNLANIILLKYDKKPAFIDLSLSAPINLEDVLLILKITQSAASVAEIHSNILSKDANFSEFWQAKDVAELVGMLVYTITELPGEKVADLKLAVQQVVSELFKNHNQTLEFGDIILAMERNGVIFKDRFLFLIEVFSLVYAEQVTISGNSKIAAEALRDKVVNELSTAQKLKLKLSSAKSFTNACEAALIGN